MTLVNSNIPHNTRRGNKSAPWISTEDLGYLYTPQVYSRVIESAGFRFGGLDFFNLYGGRVRVKNREFTVFNRGKFAAAVQVEEITAPASPGANITVTPLATELDTGGRSQMRLKFSVAIPVGDSYELYRIQTGTDAGGYTCSPFNEDAYFDTNIAEGTELMIGPSSDTTGAAGVEGLRTYLYQWNHFTQINKERLGLEGGMIALEEWEDILDADDKVIGKFNRHLQPVEKRLRKQVEAGLFMGQLNTNSVLSANAVEGGNTVVLGSQGLRKTLEDRGARLYYGDTLEVETLYQIKPHFIQTELESDMGVILCDSWLMRSFERAGVVFEDLHGGGQSYKRILRQVWGATTDDLINVSFRAAHIDGILTVFVEIPSLSDPATFGASSLSAMRGQGIYVPTETGEITLEGEKKVLKNLTIGYLNNQGEDRTRVLAVLDGMTGNTGGYTQVNDIDGINVHMLTEYVPIIINPEQMILFGAGTAPAADESS